LGEYSYEVSVSVERDKERVLGLFTRKYGKSITEGWYSAAEACLRLTPSSPAVHRGVVTGEGDVKTDLAGWKRKNEDYYAGVARAFDSASEEYDFTIRNNFINRWIRDRSIAILLKYARPEDVLLEVGCGTGAEAIEISKHVSGIVATDISSSMISLLRRKVKARGLEHKISAVEAGAAQIGGVSSSLPGGKVRVVYSFNGAMNCEPSIREVPTELAKVTEDGGYFVCSIRNTLCISEALAHAAVLQLDRMAPRKKQPIMVSVGGIDIPSYYYSPDTFARFFSSRFKVRKMFGLPAILPPAYLSDIYFRARSVLSFTERLEKTAAGAFPFNRFGDQTLFVFQKK
jgi:ubiquinone/menaquinone biosynthesis C-methylase UbiE